MKRLIKVLVLIFNSSLSSALFAQTDEETIRQIFEKEMREGHAYQWLVELTTTIGPRLSGSPGAKLAVEWGNRELRRIADSVWLQPVMVPQWVR
jgi:hypothetical protein